MDDDDDMSDVEYAESELGHSASGDSAFDSEGSTSEDPILETELHAGDDTVSGTDQPATKRPATNEKRHECTLCGYKALFPSDLDKHFLTAAHMKKAGVPKAAIDALIQSTGQKYECATCGFQSNLKADLDKHLLTQSHLIKSGVPQATIDALVQSQSTSKKYECTICGITPKSKSELDRHLLTKRHLRKSGAPGAKKYTCVPCTYETSKKTHFERHQASQMHLENMGAISPRERDFECVPCGYTTTEKREYEKHLLSATHYRNNPSIPKPKPPYYCKHCDYGTTIGRDMKRHNVSPKHLKNSGETLTTPPPATYKCLPCKYETSELRHWNLHLKTNTHISQANDPTVAPLYVCAPCAYQTSITRNYTMHLASEKHREQAEKFGETTSAQQSATPIVPPPGTNVVTYSCEPCGLKTRKKSKWEQHLASLKHGRTVGSLSLASNRSLTGMSSLARPKYVCEQCGFGTTLGHVLDSHLRSDVHTATVGMTLVCDTCEYDTTIPRNFILHQCSDLHKFLQSASTIMGLQTIDLVSFRCDLCGFETDDQRYLQLHLRSELHRSFEEQGLESPSWTCGPCEYSTTTKDAFRLHILSHRPSEVIQEASDAQTQSLRVAGRVVANLSLKGQAIDLSADELTDHVCAENLRRFKDAKIGSRRFGQSGVLPNGQRVIDFFQLPKQRTLSYDFIDSENDVQSGLLRMTISTVNTTNSSSDGDHSLVLLLPLRNQASRTLAASYVLQIMENLPLPFWELEVASLNSMLMTVLDVACRDTTSSRRPYQPPKLEVQHSEGEGTTQAKHFVTIAINGVETASLKPWTSVVCLDLSEVVCDIPCHLPTADDTLFSPDMRTPIVPNDMKDNFEQGKKIAKLLKVTFEGALGDQDACITAMDAFCSAWIPAIAARRRVAYYTSTQEIQLFQGTSNHLVELGSLYIETLGVPNRTTLPVLSPIFANDIGFGRAYAILSSMLAVWLVDFHAMTVWEHGCSLADSMLQEAREVDALQDREITVCPGTGACTLHVCPKCLRARRCQDFKQVQPPNASYDRLCSACTPRADWRPKYVGNNSDSLTQRIFGWLVDDHKAIGSSPADWYLTEETDYIRNELRILERGPGKFACVLTTQVLDENAARDRLWHGPRQTYIFPSVEALLPIYVFESLLRYHVRGNIGTSSFTLNYGIGLHPKFNLKALKQLLDGRSLHEVENAIFALRNMIILKVEMSQYLSRGLRERLSKPPPSFMPEVLNCMKTGNRLSTSTRKLNAQSVWSAPRTLLHVPIDFAWEESPYFLEQLDLIVSRYGFDSSQEQLWMRAEHSTLVFFPFSRYSVVSRWTWRDCVHFFSYKLRQLRTECDRKFGAQYHNNPALRPVFTVTMLMLMVAHRHLQSLRTQINKVATSGAQPYEGWVPDAVDEAGVPIFPVQGSPCFVSLGHKVHGQEMTSGFVSSRPTSQDIASFDPGRCNVLWETRITNFSKWAFPNERHAEILAQLHKVRIDEDDAIPALDELAVVVSGQPDQAGADEDFASPQYLEDEILELEGEGLRQPICTCGQLSIGLEELLACSAPACPVVFFHPACVGEEIDNTDIDWQCPDCSMQGALQMCTCGEAAGSRDIATCSNEKCSFEFFHLECLSSANQPEAGQPWYCDECIADHDQAGLQLQDDDQAGLQVEDVGVSQGITYRRNMLNVGNTCFMSTPLQVSYNIPELRSILNQTAEVRVPSGRKDAYLDFKDDANGLKHQAFFNKAKALFEELDESGTQPVPEQVTHEVLDACGLVTNKFSRKLGGGPAEEADCADFYDVFLEALTVTTDTSQPLDRVMQFREDGSIVAEEAMRPEQVRNDNHLEDVRMGFATPTLQDHALDHWTAHEASGYRSPVTKVAAIQYVERSLCSNANCGRVSRVFHYHYYLRLQIPQEAKTGESISLQSMLQDWLVVDHAKHDIPSPGCIRCYELRNDPGLPSDGVITHKYRLVTRVGALFALEIARDRLVPAQHPDGRDWTEKEYAAIRLEYETKPFENLLSEYESIDMAMLTQDTFSPIVEDHPDSLHPQIKGSGMAKDRYDLVGVIAYSPARRHYLAFVRFGNDYDRKWLMYDDLMVGVKEESPDMWFAKGFLPKMLFYQQDSALRESLLQQKASSVQDDLDFFGDDGVQILTSPPPEVPIPPVPSDQGNVGTQIPSSPPLGLADPKRAVSGPFQQFFDASEHPDDAKIEQEVQRRVYDEEQKLAARYEAFFDNETEKIGLLKAAMRTQYNEIVDKRTTALDAEYDAKLAAERERLQKAHKERLEQLQRSSDDNVKTAVEQSIQKAVDDKATQLIKEFDSKLTTAVQERVQARESQFDLSVKHEVEQRLSSQLATAGAKPAASSDVMTQLRDLLKLIPQGRRHEASSMFFQEVMAPGLMASDQAAAQPIAVKGDQAAEQSDNKGQDREEGLALAPRITTPVVNPSLDYLSKLGRQHVDTAGRLHIQQVIATTKTTPADRTAMKKSMPDIRIPMQWTGHRDGSSERPATGRPAVQRLAAIWSHRLNAQGVLEYLVSMSGMPPSWMSEEAVKRENAAMLTIYTAANLDFDESDEDQGNERKRRAGESGPQPDDLLGD